MKQTARWWMAGLVVVAVCAGATWVTGGFILTGVLTSSADRWVVASAIGVALAGFAALWGQWWATRAGEPPPASRHGPVAAAGERSAAVGGDNTGIIATGDDTTNTQGR